MIGGLQGENGDLNIKYLNKKSKNVGCKYLEALRRILHACKMGCEISQPKANFIAWEIGLYLDVIGFHRTLLNLGLLW